MRSQTEIATRWPGLTIDGSGGRSTGARIAASNVACKSRSKLDTADPRILGVARPFAGSQQLGETPSARERGLQIVDCDVKHLLLSCA